MSMSIRLRLTLIYTAILALLLFAISTSLYLSQSRAMSRMDQAIIRSVTERMWNVPPPENWSDHPGPPPFDQDRFKGVYIQQRAMNGDLIQADTNLGDLTLPLSKQGLQAVQQGERWIETVTLDNEPFLVHSEAVTDRRGTTTIFQAAISTTRQTEFLTAFRNILITGSVIILGVVFQYHLVEILLL